MGKKSVTKHNELVKAGYRLTLNEARIILYGISLINPLAEEFPLNYKIDIKKFSAMFGLENDKNTYQLIKDSVMNKLWERELTVDINQEKKLRLRWLTSIIYADKKGYLKVFFNPELKPLLHQLKGNFTSYNLDKIALFRRVYSVRLYEISLMNLNKSGQNKFLFKKTICEIRELLDLGEKYKKFANLRSRVIEPAVKEINTHSDIELSFKIIKLSRHPHEIEFLVKREVLKNGLGDLIFENIISPPVIEKVKWMAEGANTGWDVMELEKQFWEFSKKKGKPADIENAFLGFVKKKIAAPA